MTGWFKMGVMEGFLKVGRGIKETKGFLFILLFFFSFTLSSVLLEINFLLKHDPDARTINNSRIGRIIGQTVREEAIGKIYSLSGNTDSQQFPTLRQVVVSGDARPLIIKQYLARYNSPLLPYWKFIFETSIKYGLDYRLLVAIAQQESNLCKKIPKDSYNCWGWGIHSRGIFKCSSFSECIEIVAKGLKTEYIDKGYKTPEEIMRKYTPLSNGSWAAGVRQFMEEMEGGYETR